MIADGASTGAENLRAHLADLRARREELHLACLLSASGDSVDRSANVEAAITVDLLDERIAALEVELQDLDLGVMLHVVGRVSLGDQVTLDLGLGSEDLVLCLPGAAPEGVDTITPGSALGRAICGETVGTTVAYRCDSGRELRATILASAPYLSAATREPA